MGSPIPTQPRVELRLFSKRGESIGLASGKSAANTPAKCSQCLGFSMRAATSQLSSGPSWVGFAEPITKRSNGTPGSGSETHPSASATIASERSWRGERLVAPKASGVVDVSPATVGSSTNRTRPRSGQTTSYWEPTRRVLIANWALGTPLLDILQEDPSRCFAPSSNAGGARRFAALRPFDCRFRARRRPNPRELLEGEVQNPEGPEAQRV